MATIPDTISSQIFWLLILSMPIACISWTVTHEEVFREFREYCISKSKTSKKRFARKFFYLFTCEYCFSHYISAIMLALTGFALLLPDWRGYLIAGFAMVWISNVYMSLFALIKTDIKTENMEARINEKELEKDA